MKKTIGLALLAAVTAKQDVRRNFGSERVVDLHMDHIDDSIMSILEEHEGDNLGFTEDGFLSIKLSPEGINSLNAAGINLEDTTDDWVNHLERNLDSICSGTSEFCASQNADSFYDNYQTLDALTLRIKNMVDASSNARRVVIGQTFEGRDMHVVEIGDSSNPLAYFMCNIHAREWLTPMYCAHMIEQLLANGGHPLLNTFQFAIIPTGNPDGYDYSQKVNSMWRKTRNTNPGSSCVGTDPNRNFGDHHCEKGTSNNPCSDIFCGPNPFSTAETNNVNEYAKSVQNKMITWIDFHAYASYWLSPLGYDRGTPPAADYNKMATCMKAAADATTAVNNQKFGYGPAGSLLGAAAGASDDWFYFGYDVIYSFTVEMRGRSFQPSSSNIKLSNAEVFAGMVAQMECINDIELRGLPIAEEISPVSPIDKPCDWLFC